ncbi:MAG: DUF2240 family protein [Candidatus Lokiarchaeota archaeon]|nr:DUF2240 family protein [Candidatus Lokiarchaeota archaeon]
MIEFKIPKEDPKKFILYLWKIIDLEKISQDNLIFYISYRLFLLSPDKVNKFIKKSIENNLIEITDDKKISLNPKLREDFDIWQKKREDHIKKKEKDNNLRIDILEDLENKKKNNFNTLLKAFSDKGTINRAVSISTDTIKLSLFDQEKKSIRVTFIGREKESYFIEIDQNKKIIRHNCHDYNERRAKNKKFCKHLARLFLILKEQNQNFTEQLLGDIADTINNWEFLS